jgi:hypothetical protein
MSSKPEEATMSQSARGTTGRPNANERAVRPVEDVLNYLREFAHDQPEVAAMWCFGIGFVLGWKLKPW